MTKVIEKTNQRQPKYPSIHLSPAEIQAAAYVGLSRQVQNVVNGRIRAYGQKSDLSWERHIEGALGEAALAKYLNLYWSGLEGMRSPDVGRSIEVRVTTNHSYNLYVRPHNEGLYYFLLTGCNGDYYIRGWLPIEEIKKEKYLRRVDGRVDLYLVPQKDLYPAERFSTLPI